MRVTLRTWAGYHAYQPSHTSSSKGQAVVHMLPVLRSIPSNALAPRVASADSVTDLPRYLYPAKDKGYNNQWCRKYASVRDWINIGFILELELFLLLALLSFLPSQL